MDIEDIELKPTNVYYHEVVSFDEKGNVELKHEPISNVYIKYDSGNCFEVMSDGLILNYSDYANKTNIDIYYMTTVMAKTIVYNAENFPKGFYELSMGVDGFTITD